MSLICSLRAPSTSSTRASTLGSFRAPSLRPMQCPSCSSGPFDVDPPGRVITLEIPKIPFLIGAYHFNISLFGPEKVDFYHRSSLRGVFRIVGPPTDADGYGINGITKLQHSWKING